jgi:DNA repair photolyase
MQAFDSHLDVEQGLLLASRVHRKYQPVFEGLPQRERAALALYFLPHRSKKDALGVTRPRVVKWYCPFADQRGFPSGHRYCINVYTGCAHACQYCYASGYIAAQARSKSNFENDLSKDLDALDAYGLPPAPVHVSNSTDPLQPLEQQHRHTLHALERLAQRRHRFTTVTVLTKNPAALTDERYLRVLHLLHDLSSDHSRSAWFESAGCPPLRVECSLAFFNEASRKLLDCVAPSVESRVKAIRFLRKENIPVFVRVDPLFPRDPLPGGKAMADFDLPDIQPLPDLEEIVRFVGEVGAGHVIYSTAKITRPRLGTLPPVMQKMKQVYEYLVLGESLPFRGGSWRLPPDTAARLVARPFVNLCRQYGIEAKTCKANLISTP